MIDRRAARARNQSRSDGRVQFLAYLDPALVKALKQEALSQELNAYEIVEEALRSWLKIVQVSSPDTTDA